MKASQAWFVVLAALSGCSQTASPLALKCQVKGERNGADGKPEPFDNAALLIVDKAKKSVLSWPIGDKEPRSLCEGWDSCSVEISPEQIAVLTRKKSANSIPELGSYMLAQSERLVVNRRTGAITLRDESVVNGRLVTDVTEGSGKCEPTDMPTLPKAKF